MRRYSDFAKHIDLDALYGEIGFEVIESKGEEDRGHCFDAWSLHKNGDTTGKLSINREKRVYNCWVCGGGSLLSLVKEIKGCEFEEAIDFLLRFVNREPTDDRFSDEMDALLAKLGPTSADDSPLPYFNPKVIQHWDHAAQWAHKRHISDEVIRRFNVRYDPDAKRFSPRDKRTKEPLFEDYVGSAVILPHFWESRLVGWQQRWLDDDCPKWLPKYTNTPDFPKRYTLWGMDDAVRLHLPPVVVESVPSALRVLSLDWPAVATFGAEMTDEQLRLLRRYQQGVIFAPDNDKPGIRGLIRAAEYLEGFIPVSYIPPSGVEGADIGDVVSKTDVIKMIQAAERIY